MYLVWLLSPAHHKLQYKTRIPLSRAYTSDKAADRANFILLNKRRVKHMATWGRVIPRDTVVTWYYTTTILFSTIKKTCLKWFLVFMRPDKKENDDII